MAIKVSDLPNGGTFERRTREAYLSTPRPEEGEYTLTLYREVVIREGTGSVQAASRDDKPIIMRAADLASLEVTVEGQAMTGAQIMAGLAAAFDKIDQGQLAAQQQPAPAV